MATGLLAAGANTELAALVAAYPWIKLHVGDPGAAGTANPAANTTRKQASFSAPSGGAITNDAPVAWTSGEVTTTEAYTHASGWNASSAGAPGWTSVITGGSVTAGTAFSAPIGDLDISHTLAS